MSFYELLVNWSTPRKNGRLWKWQKNYILMLMISFMSITKKRSNVRCICKHWIRNEKISPYLQPPHWKIPLQIDYHSYIVDLPLVFNHTRQKVDGLMMIAGCLYQFLTWIISFYQKFVNASFFWVILCHMMIS